MAKEKKYGKEANISFNAVEVAKMGKNEFIEAHIEAYPEEDLAAIYDEIVPAKSVEKKK